MMEEKNAKVEKVEIEAARLQEDSELVTNVGINPSGHAQELERNFNFISIAGLGVTAGNTWMTLGGSIVSVV